MKTSNYFLFLLLIFAIQACEIQPPIPEPDPDFPCNFESDFTFENDPKQKIDYVIDCETLIKGDVTIEAGTVIEFTSSGSLIIDNGGSLKAIGTASENIIFRGVDDDQGTWRGIHFKSISSKNILDFCEITNAGQEAWSAFDDPSAIAISGRANIMNSTIRYNRGIGVQTGEGSPEETLGTFEDNQLSENSSFPVSINILNIDALKGENTYDQNGQQKIRVFSDEIVGLDLTISENSIPYFIEPTFLNSNIGVSNNVYAPASLTIEAGTVILFDENTGIYVAGDSKLSILGEAEKRVILKGDEDTNNYWKGIYHNGLSSSNIIRHTLISGAASSSFDGADTRTSFRMGSPGACCSRAYMKLENVDIENARCGISKYSTGTTLDMENVKFKEVDVEECN